MKHAVKMKKDGLHRQISSRDDKIRTCGLCVPNAALYQTEPHPATVVHNTTRHFKSQVIFSGRKNSGKMSADSIRLVSTKENDVEGKSLMGIY